ncbi:MAG TPA: NAD(P) transhydrogenase subunit alpha [Gemmatirosa sp.]|nr:NAD(P) transhydrogenase subunit alpha [Gemmatirosa sp.]
MLESLIPSIIVFVLATFLGVELIGRVPPTLHTPLMSGANAVSGITIVGALVVAGGGFGWISAVFGFLAIVCAMMNVAGGYAVTDRMLAMFRAKDDAPAALPAGGTPVKASGNGAAPGGTR